MPVLSPPTTKSKKSSIVTRSESLLSAKSDANSEASAASKRVSFNRDVHVKRIPRGSIVDQNGHLVAVLGPGEGRRPGDLWVNSQSFGQPPPQELLLREAQEVLQQVGQVTCRTSASPTERSGSSSVSSPTPQSAGKPGILSGLFKSRTLPSKSKSFKDKELKSKFRKRSESPATPSPYFAGGGYRDFTSNSNHLSPSPSSRNPQKFKSYSTENILLDQDTDFDRQTRLSRSRSPGPDFSKSVKKIKKPHGPRIPLNNSNSLGTPSNSNSANSSGSDGSSGDPQLQLIANLPSSNSNSDQNSSNSPVSSISGPPSPVSNQIIHKIEKIEKIPGETEAMYNSRVSSIAKKLSSPPSTVNRRSPGFSPDGLPDGGSKPFSYISGNNSSGIGANSGLNGNLRRSRSPQNHRSVSPKPLLRSPKEVIYAQIKVDPAIGGGKHTVHTSVSNSNSNNVKNHQNTTTIGSTTMGSKDKDRIINDDYYRSSLSPDLGSTTKRLGRVPQAISPQRVIHHSFMHENDKENHLDKKSSFSTSTTNKTTNGFTTSPVPPPSLYDTKPKIIDEHSKFSNDFLRDQTLFSYRKRSPSPSPSPRPRGGPGTSFYYGDQNHGNHGSFGKNNGGAFDYGSSSREASPAANIPSAKLVREVERKNKMSSSSNNYVGKFYDEPNSPDWRSKPSSNNDYSRINTTNTNSNSRYDVTDRATTNISSKTNGGYSHHNHNGYPVGGGYTDDSLTRKKSKITPLNGDFNGDSTSTHRRLNDVEEIIEKTRHQQQQQQQNQLPGKGILNNHISHQNQNQQNQRSSTMTTTSATTKSKVDSKPSLVKSSSSGGLFSSLMRRNKDKKVAKQNTLINGTRTRSPGLDDPSTNITTPEPTTTDKDGKIKRQRAKFLSSFLDKSFSSGSNAKNKVSKTTATTTTSGMNQQQQQSVGLNNVTKVDMAKQQQEKKVTTNGAKRVVMMTNGHHDGNGHGGHHTDSEIEEVERRRDAGRPDWSSGEEEFHHIDHQHQQNTKSHVKSTRGQITRGKTYNFGDYDHDPRNKSYYHDGNDSDYRKELATAPVGGTPRYSSVTLGRPSARTTYNDEDHRTTSRAIYDDVNYSKSLDRRVLRNRSPPRIIVTPNTPAVHQEEPKWGNGSAYHRPSSYDHRPLGKKVSGLSKSSYELDNQDKRSTMMMNNGGGNSKLRYFGDTDMEDLESCRSRRDKHNNNGAGVMRNGSYLNGGSKMSNGSHLTPSTRSNSKYNNHRVAGPSSSHNSSESDNGYGTTSGQRVNGSQRSVYLHAAAVADIPANQNGNGLSASRRTLSRDELSNHSGAQKQTRHLARSMSVLAPWRPRHFRDKYEVHYGNDGTLKRGNVLPPKPPRSPHQKSMSPSPARALSSESLLRDNTSPRRTFGGGSSSMTRGGGPGNNDNDTLNKGSIKRPPRRSGTMLSRNSGASTLNRNTSTRQGSTNSNGQGQQNYGTIDRSSMGRSATLPAKPSTNLSRSKSMPKDSKFFSGWWKRFKESK